MKTTKIAILVILSAAWLAAAAVGVSANGRSVDIVRQWVVCQYVNAGRNPWELAKDILVAKYGDGDSYRATVYAIPKEVPADLTEHVLPEIGPPEATYPPPAIGLLALTVGLVPNPEVVLWGWLAVNILALAWVGIELTRLWSIAPISDRWAGNLQLVLCALLLFPATYATFVTGQLSLLLLALLLVAADPSRPWLARGVALGVALIKPSVALPFFLLPLARREWGVLLSAVAVQATAAGYVVLRTGVGIDLFGDWLAVAGYFLQGQYTIQEWLGRVALRFHALARAVPFLLLALCGATLVAARRCVLTQRFAIAAVTSVFWTYHGRYDFVILLPVLMPIVGWRNEESEERHPLIGVVLFVVLAVALLPEVYRGEGAFTHCIRWMARITVIWLFVREYLRVYWERAGRQVTMRR